MRMRYRLKKKALIKAVVIVAVVIIIVSVVSMMGKKQMEGAICLDAGHGGNDVGAVYNGRLEKDDNLKIAQEVGRVLEQQGEKVLLTRDTDKTVSLGSRTKLANSRKASLFVSMHRNSGAGTGIEIWVEHTSPKKDTALANAILKELNRAGLQTNRGVKTGMIEDEKSDFHVNRETNMPSCLVEFGFIDNETDNTLFEQNLKVYAKGVAKAIMATLNRPFQEALYTES